MSIQFDSLDAICVATCKRVYRDDAAQFIRAFLAGIYISFGAVFMSVVKVDTSLPPAISALLSGLVFSIGLFAIFTSDGAELYTGNCLGLIYLLSAETPKWKIQLVRMMIVTLLGNFLGCIFVQSLVLVSGFDISALTILANAKATSDSFNVFFKAILCNMLVCLSVLLYSRNPKSPYTFAIVALPVGMFVACGFEHSIANAFIFLFSRGANLEWSIILNLIVAIIGNTIGGFILGFLNYFAEEF